MTVDVPVQLDASMPKESENASHEPLGDVLDDEGSSKTQRLIGWVSGLLIVAGAIAAWRLL